MKIIYKILNTLAVLAIIPVLLCLPMFQFIMVVSLNTGNQLLSLIGGMLDINQIITNATGIDLENLPEYYTLQNAYQMFFGSGSKLQTAGFDTSALPEELIHWFAAAGALFVLALLCAVAALIIGLFVKKKLVTASVSALGFVSLLAAGKCFSHIAGQLVSGKLSLTKVISGMEALADYTAYLDYIHLDIRLFQLASAYTMLLVIFGALILLNVGFHLADTTASK